MDRNLYESLFWQIHLLEVWEQYLNMVNHKCPTREVEKFIRNTRYKAQNLYSEFENNFPDGSIGAYTNVSAIITKALQDTLELQLWEMTPLACDTPGFFIFGNRVRTPLGWEKVSS